jgi:hypothetical protein
MGMLWKKRVATVMLARLLFVKTVRGIWCGELRLSAIKCWRSLALALLEEVSL